MIARFTDDHVRVRALSAKLSAFLNEPCAPIVPGFARCRWELVRELSTHLACERRLLSRLPIADDTLDKALHRHMLDWTGAAIQARWSAYVHEARALLRRLDQRMDHEERVLFPMLATS